MPADEWQLAAVLPERPLEPAQAVCPFRKHSKPFSQALIKALWATTLRACVAAAWTRTLTIAMHNAHT